MHAPNRANARVSTVARRLVAGRCQSCGNQFFYRRTGRPKNFCDQKCRQSDFRRSGRGSLQIDESAPKSKVNSETFRPDSGDRPLRIVAGPQLSPSALHAASVGAARVIEHNNRLNIEGACLIKRHSPPINVVGGFRFPGAPAFLKWSQR
jgi:hypothetical protein